MENATADQSRTEGGTPGAENSEAINRAADSVAAKHGVAAGNARVVNPPTLSERPKGGRRTVEEEAREWLHKNGLVAIPSGAKSGPETQPADSSPAPGQVAPSYVVSPEFVEELSLSLLTTLQDWRVRAAFVRIKAISKDANLAKELSAEVVPPEGTLPMMAKGFGELCRKYGFAFQWAPEVIVVAGGLVWFNQDAKLHRKLDEMEARIVAARKKADETVKGN